MKSIATVYGILLLAFCTVLSNTSAAQTKIWSVDAALYVGKMVTFEEYANTVSYDAATKTCVIKLADPDVAGSPTITVVVHHINKGKHLRILKHLEGNTITITGRLISGKDGFVINGDNPRTKIVDEPEGPTNIDPAPLPPVGPPPSEHQ